MPSLSPVHGYPTREPIFLYNPLSAYQQTWVNPTISAPAPGAWNAFSLLNGVDRSFCCCLRPSRQQNAFRYGGVDANVLVGYAAFMRNQ